MTDAITLLGPFQQVLTLSGLPHAGPIRDDALSILEDAGVLVRGGEILGVDRYSELQGSASVLWKPPRPTVLIPGLVDSHTHIAWAGTRARDYSLRIQGVSYQEIAAQGGGIMDTVRQTRTASEDELASLTLQRCRALCQRGVTTVEIKSGYGLSVAEELKQLRAIRTAAALSPARVVSTCLGAHMKGPEFSGAEDYLQLLIDQLLPQVLEEELSKRVDIFVEEGAFSVAQARSYLLAAKRMGFDLTLHSDQFSRGASLLAAELGARSADHLEVSEEEDLIALRDADVVATVLPGASLGLGIPFAPARQALDLGCCVAMASDWNPGSAPNGDLLSQAAFMGAQQHLSMAETFAGITFRAARALGLSDCGSIAPGMRADFALFPCDDYRAILYYQGSLRPYSVWHAGAQVFG